MFQLRLIIRHRFLPARRFFAWYGFLPPGLALRFCPGVLFPAGLPLPSLPFRFRSVMQRPFLFARHSFARYGFLPADIHLWPPLFRFLHADPKISGISPLRLRCRRLLPTVFRPFGSRPLRQHEIRRLPFGRFLRFYGHRLQLHLGFRGYVRHARQTCRMFRQPGKTNLASRCIFYRRQ